GGRARRGDRRRVRQPRRAEEGRQRRRRQPLRFRLDVARSRRHGPFRLLDAEPGLADHAVGRAAARHRRLGALLLPEVPEPPPRGSSCQLRMTLLFAGRSQVAACAAGNTARTRSLVGSLILNVAELTSVGFVPWATVARVTCLRLTHFDFRSLWKTTYLPTKVCAAVTETSHLPCERLVRVSVGGAAATGAAQNAATIEIEISFFIFGSLLLRSPR